MWFMRFVAFFRNVNLGQGHSPTRGQLEAAFAAAAAHEARSFQTAGTVVFSAEHEPAAAAVIERARGVLLAQCGLPEPAYFAPLDHLADLVAADPFAVCDLSNVLDSNATFMSRPALAHLSLPLRSPRGDVEVLRLTPYLALSVRRQIDGHVLSPTAFFEKLLGAPATTRSWGTILRLVSKHSAPRGKDAV